MGSPRRVGVLADDFSGAGDVALAFEAMGMTAEIWTPARGTFVGGAPTLPGARVWIIDTESRGVSPENAARAVRRAWRALSHWKPDFFFKKIDSTLRGPVGAELAAFIEALSASGPVTFVPAFPSLGRTTVGGRHFVHGVPLHRTPFGKEPRHPIRSNDLHGIIAHSWSSGFRRQNGAARERVWIPDVERDRDMADLARQALAKGGAVGSAGFAAAIAREMGRGEKARGPEVPATGGAVGVVVGSAHPLAGRQVERLKNVSPRSDVFLLERPQRRGAPDRVLRRLVSDVRALEKIRRIRRWVVTGGETAFALARLWKEPRWRVVRSLEPGVALCRSLGRPLRWLVLKPGGFGSLDVLSKAVRQFLKKDGSSGSH